MGQAIETCCWTREPTGIAVTEETKGIIQSLQVTDYTENPSDDAELRQKSDDLDTESNGQLAFGGSERASVASPKSATVSKQNPKVFKALYAAKDPEQI